MRLENPILSRLIILTVVVVLGLPLCLGLLRLDDAELRQRYNREPEPRPAWAEVLRDPVAGFQQGLRHFSDRVAGVGTMTEAVQRMRFEWLSDPSTPMVARRDELVYLASFGTLRPPMTNIRDSCRIAEAGGDPWLDRLIANTAEVFAHLDAPARKVGFLIVPSKPVLYHDRLPRGTPASFAALCAQAARNAELGQWERELAAQGIAVSYPLDRLRQERDDPAYYPAANFHAEGKSAHDAVVSLMDLLYPEQSPWPEVRFDVAPVRADLEYLLAFPRQTPMQVPNYGPHATRLDPAALEALRAEASAYRHARVYHTAKPIIGGEAVVIGNSFAFHGVPNIAPYFDRTTLFGMAAASDEELDLALEQLTVSADAVIFMVQDTAAKHWLWQRERDALDRLAK